MNDVAQTIAGSCDADRHRWGETLRHVQRVEPETKATLR